VHYDIEKNIHMHNMTFSLGFLEFCRGRDQEGAQQKEVDSRGVYVLWKWEINSKLICRMHAKHARTHVY